jgi:hypothetical protein
MIHHPRFPVLLAVLALPLTLTGCGERNPTYEEMIEINRKALAPILDKHRAAVTAKLDAIKAVAKEAKAAPIVQAREPMAETATIPGSSYEALKAGVLLANADWADFEGTDETPIDLDTRLPIGKIQSALASGELPSSYSIQGLEEQFGVLAGIRQAALIRVHRYAKPQPSIGAKGERRFVGGKAYGDVQVYDLATGKRIGAFPFEIGQSDSASITSKDEESIQRELELSFARGVDYDLREELAAFAAGKEGPATPGAAEKASLKTFANKIKGGIIESHGFAFPKRVDIEEEAGVITVTIHAGDPIYIADKRGITRPEVKAMVEKILGSEAVVKVVKAAEEKAPTETAPGEKTPGGK